MSNKRLYYSLIVVVITVLTVGIILNLQIRIDNSQVYDDLKNEEEYDFQGDYIGEELEIKEINQPVKGELEEFDNVKKNLIQ